MLVLRLPCDMTEMKIAFMEDMSSRQFLEKRAQISSRSFCASRLDLFLKLSCTKYFYTLKNTQNFK
jgi:hypothetical protein